MLWAWRDELGLAVTCAHLNHLIREADAEADASFVAEHAARWGVPCVVEARDVPATARELKLAIEEAARRVRYSFLARVARQVGATRIAVGHNADDQSETVLMHWLRGAGLAGARGMLPATRMADLRLLSEQEMVRDLVLVRPLLETRREQILTYCQVHNLAPRYDRSNLDTTLYRNKLRQELLPYLEREFRPNFREILRRSASVARADHDLLSRLLDDAWAETVQYESDAAIILDLERWRGLHLALQRGTVRQAVQRLRRTLRDISLEHVDTAVAVARHGDASARLRHSRRAGTVV